VYKYDPLASLSGWAVPPSGPGAFAGLRHDPWADLVAAAREGRRGAPSKYDPLPAFFAAVAAGGSRRGAARYDPLAGLLETAGSPDWQGPTGRGRYCPLAAALDAAAGWEAPKGDAKYCPLPGVLAAEAPSKASAGGSRRWDPLAWLLDGWAANSSGWEPAGHAAAPRFDPAGALLHADAPSRSRRSKFDPVPDLLAGGCCMVV
jgi:hypothetical protein